MTLKPVPHIGPIVRKSRGPLSSCYFYLGTVQIRIRGKEGRKDDEIWLIDSHAEPTFQLADDLFWNTTLNLKILLAAGGLPYMMSEQKGW